MKHQAGHANRVAATNNSCPTNQMPGFPKQKSWIPNSAPWVETTSPSPTPDLRKARIAFHEPSLQNHPFSERSTRQMKASIAKKPLGPAPGQTKKNRFPEFHSWSTLKAGSWFSESPEKKKKKKNMNKEPR